VLPALSEKEVKLYFVSIGTPERGLEFVDKTGGLLLLVGSGCCRFLSLIAVRLAASLACLFPHYPS
jgi:hypothetical protein